MRQFILENQKIKNGLITLEGKDYKYLRQVLRVKVGDMVSVRMKDGSLQNTTVARVDENTKKIELQICANTEAGATTATFGDKTITRGVQAGEIEGAIPPVEYWLFQFLPKPQKFEQIVKQATECGVSYVVPVIGEYTEKSSVMALQGNKKERLERIVKEARQQSGSPVDTKVLEPVNLEEAIKLACSDGDEPGTLSFVLSERDDGNTLFERIKNAASAGKIKKVCIAVGSEGGISPQEVSFLEEKGLFAPVHFAVNILRCETAALYGIAAVQSFIGEICLFKE